MGLGFFLNWLHEIFCVQAADPEMGMRISEQPLCSLQPPIFDGEGGRKEPLQVI